MSTRSTPRVRTRRLPKHGPVQTEGGEVMRMGIANFLHVNSIGGRKPTHSGKSPTHSTPGISPKWVKMILGKIIKIAATGCHILKQNSPNSISAGAPPQTPLGSLQHSPDPLAQKCSTDFHNIRWKGWKKVASTTPIEIDRFLLWLCCLGCQRSWISSRVGGN